MLTPTIGHCHLSMGVCRGVSRGVGVAPPPEERRKRKGKEKLKKKEEKMKKIQNFREKGGKGEKEEGGREKR